MWDLFLGGSSETRPFGDAVLDGYVLSSRMFSISRSCMRSGIKRSGKDRVVLLDRVDLLTSFE